MTLYTIIMIINILTLNIKVIKHEHRTMEAFLDDTFGPIEDFFEDDYLR